MKLTVNVKKHIVQLLMNHALGETLEKLIISESKIMDMVYRTDVSEELEAQLAAIPVGYVMTTCCFYVLSDNVERALMSSTSGLLTRNRTSCSNVHPANTLNRECKAYFTTQPYALIDIRDHTDLVTKYEEAYQASEDYAGLANRTFNTASAIVNACTTDVALMKTWPEIEPLITHLFDSGKPSSVKLPAMITPEMNTMFNLPIVEN